MIIKNNQSNLEVKLESLKDQFLAALRSTKLVVNPRIEGFTLFYEKRRGNRNNEQCRLIQTGLKIRLKTKYSGYVDFRIEKQEPSESYKATLEVLSEKTEEINLAYQAIEEVTKFINVYLENKKRF